jgi:hypothetical protein
VKNVFDKGGCSSSTISAILSVTHCLTERAPAEQNFEPIQTLIHAVQSAIKLGVDVVDVSCEECLSVIGQIKGKNNWIPTIRHHCYDDMFQDGCPEKIIDPLTNQDVGSISKFFHVC